MATNKLPLGWSEKKVEAAKLLAQRLPKAQIAKRLKTSTTQVHRWLADPKFMEHVQRLKVREDYTEQSTRIVYLSEVAKRTSKELLERLTPEEIAKLPTVYLAKLNIEYLRLLAEELQEIQPKPIFQQYNFMTLGELLDKQAITGDARFEVLNQLTKERLSLIKGDKDGEPHKH